MDDRRDTRCDYSRDYSRDYRRDYRRDYSRDYDCDYEHDYDRTNNNQNRKIQISFSIAIEDDPEERVVKRRYNPDLQQQHRENERYKKKVMPNNYIKPNYQINTNTYQIQWTNIINPVMMPFIKGNDGNCLLLETEMSNIGRYQNSGKSHPLCFDFQNIMFWNQANVKFNWLDTLDFSVFMLESLGINISNLIFVLGGIQDNVAVFRHEITKREYNRPFIIIDAKTTQNERNKDDNTVYSIAAIMEGIIITNDYMAKNEDLLCQAQNAKLTIEKNAIKESMKNCFGNSHVMNTSRDCDLRLTEEIGYASMTFPKDLFVVYNK